MKTALPFCLALLFLLRGTYSSEQGINFNKVLPPEGKAFLHVTGMVQDPEGYMWFATKKGLFRYDGYDMKVFKNDLLDTNSLGTDALEAICIDKAGLIWIATYGEGLERFDPSTGIFTHFRHNPKDPSSLGSNWVSTVFVDSEGILWVGTGDGLDRYNSRANNFIHIRHRPQDPESISCNAVVSIYEDRQGSLWFGTGSVYAGESDEGGLNRMDRKTGKFKRYVHEPGNPHSLINNKVKAIFEDSKGNFWVGTSGDGLHLMDRTRGIFQRYPYDRSHPEKLSRPPFKKFPFFDFITFITEDISGAIWIGTSESGLNYYDPKTKKIRHYELEKDTAGAFTSESTWAAYTSRDGVIWISTIQGGLYRINPLQQHIPFYTSTTGKVHSFYEGADGSVWTGTENGLVIQNYQGKNEAKLFVNEPGNPASLSNNSVHVIKADRKGNIWIGTEDGLNVLDKKTGKFFSYHHDHKNKNSLSNDFILTIYEDRKSDLWIGTTKGLNRMNLKTGSFTRYVFHQEDTISPILNVVSSVLEDRQGNLWAGCWMVGDVHLLNRETGEYASFLKGRGIYSFCEDTKGTFWVGGAEGLFQYNPSKKTFLPFIDSSTHTQFSNIRSIVEDNDGNLWMSTQKGILKLNPEHNVTRIYGKAYGINGNNLSWGAGFKGIAGKLFFGNNSGYFVFLPGQLPKSLPPPQIIISDIHLANKSLQYQIPDSLPKPLSSLNLIRLHHNQNSFSFAFTAIDYSGPEENRHFFMLENYDEDWLPAGSERKAVYYNVPPGKYVFKVKAVNSNGIWAEKSMAIIITPPWWSTWWFRIAAFVFIVSIIYGFIRWRLQQKFHLQLERSEKEKLIAEMSQKTTELEMQALRSQMNPHFIFNSLNSINRFILQNNKTEASEYLTKFSRLVRLILQNSQADLIPLESELESLQLYLELETLRFDQHFEYRITVEDDLDVSALKVPPLIIQPYAENAIWHGLMHTAEKGHLDIKLYQTDDSLFCKIIDDGIGRKKAAELKSKSASTYKSMGMRITADRIALLQQKKQLDPFIQVNDLILPDGSPGGTEVILKIPVHYD